MVFLRFLFHFPRPSSLSLFLSSPPPPSLFHSSVSLLFSFPLHAVRVKKLPLPRGTPLPSRWFLCFLPGERRTVLSCFFFKLHFNYAFVSASFALVSSPFPPLPFRKSTLPRCISAVSLSSLRCRKTLPLSPSSSFCSSPTRVLSSPPSFSSFCPSRCFSSSFFPSLPSLHCSSARPPLVVTLYVGNSCCLCEKALFQLRRVLHALSLPFSVEYSSSNRCSPLLQNCSSLSPQTSISAAAATHVGKCLPLSLFSDAAARHACGSSSALRTDTPQEASSPQQQSSTTAAAAGAAGPTRRLPAAAHNHIIPPAAAAAANPTISSTAAAADTPSAVAADTPFAVAADTPPAVVIDTSSAVAAETPSVVAAASAAANPVLSSRLAAVTRKTTAAAACGVEDAKACLHFAGECFSHLAAAADASPFVEAGTAPATAAAPHIEGSEQGEQQLRSCSNHSSKCLRINSSNNSTASSTSSSRSEAKGHATRLAASTAVRVVLVNVDDCIHLQQQQQTRLQQQQQGPQQQQQSRLQQQQGSRQQQQGPRQQQQEQERGQQRVVVREGEHETKTLWGAWQQQQQEEEAEEKEQRRGTAVSQLLLLRSRIPVVAVEGMIVSSLKFDSRRVRQAILVAAAAAAVEEDEGKKGEFH